MHHRWQTMAIQAFIQTLIHRLRGQLRTFGAAKGGNVTLIFALAAIPMVGFVGAAVDYSRANSDKAAMQSAVDATALMLSKSVSTLTTAQINQKATDYFTALFTRKDVANIAVTPSYTTSGGSQIVITATGTVPTTFMKAMGISMVDVSVSSTIAWGNSRLRVALVLDNTGSMNQSGKITALKTATNNLLAQLQGAATQNGDVYVSIIPFVKDVAVDPTTNYSKSWIDWTDWQAQPPFMNTWIPANQNAWEQVGPGSNCPFNNNSHGFTCTNKPATASGASSASKIPSSGTYNAYVCPSIDSGNKNALKASIYYNGCYDSTATMSGSSATCPTNSTHCSCAGSGATKVCSMQANRYFHTWRGSPNAAPAHSTWNGCITDRGDSTAPNAGNYDTNATAPDTTIKATLFPAEQYNICPGLQLMMPLSYDWATMTTVINAMVANGNTNQAVGLDLAWMSLVGGGPFPTPPAMDPNFTYQQVIILLTDGLNTEDRWYTSQTSIDARQQMTCDNINAAKITLYTVQVNTSGDPTSTLLQKCAGSQGKYPDSSKFFLLTSSSEIVTTFAQIGTALSNLRVAK